MMDSKEVLLQWFINFLLKKLLGVVLKMIIMSDQHPLALAARQLAEELQKPVIRNLKKSTVTFYRQCLVC